MCACTMINALMKYVRAIIIYFLSATLKRIDIFIIHSTITYKHDFHSKHLKRNEKRDYYEKAQKTGGFTAQPSNFFPAMFVAI